MAFLKYTSGANGLRFFFKAIVLSREITGFYYTTRVRHSAITACLNMFLIFVVKLGFDKFPFEIL